MGMNQSHIPAHRYLKESVLEVSRLDCCGGHASVETPPVGLSVNVGDGHFE